MGNVNRGDGTTSRQMTDAPQGAVYVWVNGEISYPRQLAFSLGREDLKIFRPGQVESQTLRGLRCDIVLDHATRLTDRQWEALWEFRARQPKPSLPPQGTP